MAVNWSWKHKMGVITCYNKRTNSKYKVNIYGANCLGALIQEFKENGKDMYDFWGFWNDEKHLKNCLGLTRGYDNLYQDIIVKIKLNVFYKDCVKIATYFAKANIIVELYYKEIK